ncbi:hypothetical protein [Pseudothauera rhizosphaerae]|uniref:Uncharacterized protein n=1 Tax=Pseudothauera rhizosphaerae TaxID=2565932 RepID=A0A4S4ACL2_9RHOO|nr:hypothetical protein [Pseudothauera rhizosphaerae]THF55910.1 hypothetical protein E6O51_20200 [Pseudothauera rhizosphaerae]
MSCKLQKLDLCIIRGATVALPIRIESDTLAYATINDVLQSAPVQIVASGHGIPDGWRAAVMNVKGPVELNAANNPPRDSDFRRTTRLDTSTVAFNAVNGAGFKPYVSGGQLAYYLPVNLALYDSARMDVRNRVGGDLLASFSTDEGTLGLDAANDCLWLRLTAEQSAELSWTKGVFDAELVEPDGTVLRICSSDSTITVTTENTTSHA